MTHPSSPAAAPFPEQTDTVGLVLALLGLAWIIGLSLTLHGLGWLIHQVMFIVGENWPLWLWPLLGLLHGFLLLLPLLPLAWFASGRAQPIFQTWSLAALFILLLAPARLAPMTAVPLANFLQLIGLSLFLVGLLAVSAWRGRASGAMSGINRGTVVMALLITPILLLPWLRLGALGSWLDIGLNLLNSLLLGLTGGWLLSRWLLRPLAAFGPHRFGLNLLIGLAAGATGLMLATGVGFNGAQLLLAFTLPAVAGTAVSLIRRAPGENWLAIAVLLTAAAAGPNLFIDPAELQLVLGLQDMLLWAFVAAVLTMLLAWGIGLFFNLRRRPLVRPSAAVWAGLAVAWLAAGLVYGVSGQPGTHGDRLFVILRDQADLTGAAQIEDLAGRRQFVYQTLTSHADSSQADLRRSLERLRVPYTPYYLVNGLELPATPWLRLWLSQRPEVDRVLDSPVLRPLPRPIPIETGDQSGRPSETIWNLTLIGADQVWQEWGVTGSGIVIGQSDSGVQWDHPELNGRYRGRAGNHDYNWYDPWLGTTAPYDTSGHGTHTLGTILGQKVGVAPGATWFGCANLVRNLANPALYLDCLQFMLAPFPLAGDPFRDGRPDLAADVLNNSWGCPEIEGCDADSLQPAVAALRQAGIFVVASAGNEGPGCASLTHPLAIYAEAFAVGAIDRWGNLSSFSSVGPVSVDGSGRLKPDIVAPGDDILSAMPGSSYGRASGTSMAGPHVVGAVALIWSANPVLRGDIAATETILRETARPYSGPLPACLSEPGPPNSAVGYGVLDVYAAVQRALENGR